MNGKVTNAVVSAGGKGYTYGMVDLGAIGNTSASTKASLIPIIPPSKGHGSDIYKELGSDRVLVFARFDTSTTNDFPVNTSFSQIGILKNPTSIGSTSTFTDPTFSSVGALKFTTTTGTPTIGNSVTQVVTGGTAKGFVGTKLISLDTQFTQGVSNPEINKKSGDIVYLDNRPLITRNARQKEDVKIILEF